MNENQKHADSLLFITDETDENDKSNSNMNIYHSIDNILKMGSRSKNKFDNYLNSIDKSNYFRCWSLIDIALSYAGKDRKTIIELIEIKYPKTIEGLCSIYELKEYCLYSNHNMIKEIDGNKVKLDCICFSNYENTFSLESLYFSKDFIMEISSITGISSSFFLSRIDFSKGKYNIRLLYSLLDLIDPDYQLTEEMPEETMKKLNELFNTFYLLLGLKDSLIFQMNNPFESNGRDNVDFSDLMEDFFRD